MELLEKNSKKTQNKKNFFIFVKDKSTHIKTRFNEIIQLDKTKKYEMALVNLETYYSFPNVDSSNNSFSYSPDNGVTWTNYGRPIGQAIMFYIDFLFVVVGIVVVFFIQRLISEVPRPIATKLQHMFGSGCNFIM